MLYEVITLEFGTALDPGIPDHDIGKALGLNAQARITSYNVCYTKLLRAFVLDDTRMNSVNRPVDRYAGGVKALIANTPMARNLATQAGHSYNFV